METIRCFGTGDPLYEAYHDHEWGRPVADTPDESALFERITLEGAQAGLSWITVLRKREGYREAFHGFDPGAVAAMTADDVDELLGNPGIVRNRAKVTSAIGNARALLAMHDDGERLADLIARYAPEPRATAPLTFADVPGQTPGSVTLSNELKKRGFRFVGPTTMYATMQAVGAVDDHIHGCFLARADI